MILPGTFVRVLFPTREQPHVPGLMHIGYALTVANQEAIVAYTTSQPWPAGAPLPAGVRLFDGREAVRLNLTKSHRHLPRPEAGSGRCAGMPEICA